MNKPLFLLAALILAGCASPGQTNKAGPLAQPITSAAVPCSAARKVVIGIDRSGSYDSKAAALAKLADFIEKATCQGDTLLVRWIADDSFGPTAAIFTARLPVLRAPPPTPANPFARRKYEADLAAWTVNADEFTAAQRDVVRTIETLKPEEAPATDVHGFFIKAGELLSTTPPGMGRLVLVVSDLEDNVGREAPFDLTGTAVLVLAFETDDPARAAGTRTEWQTRLIEAGATRVVWRDPSEPLLDAGELTAALAGR